MKTFALAGLVAAAAALPQYSIPSISIPDSLSTQFDSASQSRTHHRHHSHASTTAVSSSSTCTEEGASSETTPAAISEPASFPTLVVDSSSGVGYPYGTGSGSAFATGTGTAYSHHPTGTAVSVPSSTASGTSNSTSASNSTAANNDFLHGINIGNWLILEKWMDSSSTFSDAFANANDQWSFDGISGAQDALQRHWSSWFTQADVATLKSSGFNALRIPIGFWAFDNSGTPYQEGAAFWLDQAIGWARDAGMKVLVDCHGSPGSQNGQDHSGHAGAIDWQSGDNLAKSTTILVNMAKKYGAANYSDVVWGIEMVNEPTANAPNVFSTSQSWAQDTYTKMLAVVENKQLRIVTHDSFMGPQKFVSIAKNLIATVPVLGAALTGSNSDAKGTTFGVDQHNYQLYTDSDNALDQDAHISKACGWAQNLATAKATMPTIVGEWSALTNICAKSDGSTVSSNTGCNGASGCSCTSDDPSKWSDALVKQVRMYVEAQLEVYEANSDGHFLWSFKGPGGWGLTGPQKAGAFPSNVVTDRKYPGICNGK